MSNESWLLVGVATVYLLPFIVALAKGASNAGGILALNLIAGWTLVGWLVALVWAFGAEPGWRRRLHDDAARAAIEQARRP